MYMYNYTLLITIYGNTFDAFVIEKLVFSNSNYERIENIITKLVSYYNSEDGLYLWVIQTDTMLGKSSGKRQFYEGFLSHCL